MIYQVLMATMNSPIKNDFVQTCQKYLDFLKINLTFDQISKMSKWKMKNLVHEKVSQAGFSYLLEKTSTQNVSNIKYEEKAGAELCQAQVKLRLAKLAS